MTATCCWYHRGVIESPRHVLDAMEVRSCTRDGQIIHLRNNRFWWPSGLVSPVHKKGDNLWDPSDRGRNVRHLALRLRGRMLHTGRIVGCRDRDPKVDPVWKWTNGRQRSRWNAMTFGRCATAEDWAGAGLYGLDVAWAAATAWLRRFEVLQAFVVWNFPLIDYLERVFHLTPTWQSGSLRPVKIDPGDGCPVEGMLVSTVVTDDVMIRARREVRRIAEEKLAEHGVALPWWFRALFSLQ